MQYAFYTGDTQGIETILKNVDEFRSRTRWRRARRISSRTATGNCRSCICSRWSDAASAAECEVAGARKRRRRAYAHARRAVEQDAALGGSAARSRLRAKGTRRLPAPASSGCANSKPLRTAAGLAPDNPRIKLIQAICAPNTAADPAAVDRWRSRRGQFRSRAAVAAGQTRLGPRGSADDARRDLPAARRSRGGARCTRARVGARAGLSAGAAASAGCRGEAALNYTVHVNRRQLPSFMSPQLQLFDARGAADRWTVRVSRRARRLSVRVYPGGRVEVVVPPGASPAAVQKFIGTHRQWIHRRVEDLSTAAAVDDSASASIKLPAIGRHFAVEYEHAGRLHGARARRRRERTGRERAVARTTARSPRRCATGSPTWRSMQLGSELAKVARRRRLPLRAHADSPAAHALGQLLRERHHQPERVPAVPASGGRALPADPRAVPHAAHESLREILGAGRELRARLSRARPRAAARLAGVPGWMFS